MRSSTFAWAALPALALLALPSAARADDVLIYQTFANDVKGGNAAAAEAEEVLEGLGHTVTVVASFTPTLPADLSVFDTIWVIQLVGITPGDQNKLRDFIKAGGGLYLTGEREGCCGVLNDSLDDFFGPIVSPAMATFGNQVQEGGALFVPSAFDTFGITSTPNVITQWETLGAGVIGNAQADRVVFSTATSLDGAMAFVGEDMHETGGCVYVAMDLSYWLDVVAPGQNLAPLAENIQTFLEGCADTDHDGLSDVGEGEFGTDVDDPDSDDDGLCDGFGTVIGTCVAGESPFDDFDDDDLINPLDPDDDGDGLSTSFELAAEALAPNADGDDIPAYYDLNSDADFITDEEEGAGDYDDDGIPSIVDLDDFPPECDVEADCGPAGSGLYCNLDVGYCQPGCFAGSNGCPDGQICTSDDETIGECITAGEGGGGQGGSGPGGSGEGAGNPSGGNGQGAGNPNGGNAANGGGGAGAEDGGGDDGCNCTTSGTSDGRAPVGAALLAAIAAFLRRRRTMKLQDL